MGVRRETPIIGRDQGSLHGKAEHFFWGWVDSQWNLQTISRGGVRGLLLRQRPSDLFFFCHALIRVE